MYDFSSSTPSFNSNNITPASLDEFIRKMEICVQSVDGLMSNLTQCYVKLQCNDPEYLSLRAKVFGEAAMYGQVILPVTIDFVQDLKDSVEVFNFMHNVTQFTQSLSTQAGDFRRAKLKADKLRSQHAFVLGNLDQIKGQAKVKEATFTNGSVEAEDISAATRTGAVVAGAAGGATIGAIASAGTATTTVAISATTAGFEALFVAAAAPVIWPAALVGGTILGLSVILAAVSNSKRKEAARLEASAVSVKVLIESLVGFTQIVEVGADLLGNLKNELSGLEKGAGRAHLEAYLDMAKEKIVRVLTLCDQFLSSRGKFQRALGSICEETVGEEFRKDWRKRLTIWESEHSISTR